jgi:hypothetical protein
MRRYTGWLAGVALAFAAAPCGAQDLPSPRKEAGPPAPVRPPNGEVAAKPLVPLRDPYPPPLPAVVDPRTGAWRQVYVPPGECEGPEVEMRVGRPCPRCGDKLRHPFHGHVWGAVFGRPRQPGDALPGSAVISDASWAPAGPGGVELLPPQLPAR